MKKYSYKIEYIPQYSGKDEIERRLNKLGEEGWELVQYSVDLNWYFLRKKA